MTCIPHAAMVRGYPATSDRSRGWLRYLYRKATTPDNWDKDGRPHAHWGDVTGEPMTSWTRFDLVRSSYAIPLMADRTPAWRKVYGRILDQFIVRYTGYWAAKDWLDQIGDDPRREQYPEAWYRVLIPPFLRVTPKGYKYWETRVTVNGRRRGRGLGPYPMVSLKEAREKAQELRVRVRNGEDPFGTRDLRELAFAEAAALAIADRQSRWSNPEVRKKDWLRTFERYVYPKIGRCPVTAIAPHDVIDVLRGVEKSFPRSLPLVHQRMGVVFKWSRTNGHCTDNPVADVVLKDIFGAAPSVRLLQYAGGPAGRYVFHRSFPDRRRNPPVRSRR